MPIYVYTCPKCESILEQCKKVCDRDKLPDCDCGTKMRRSVTVPSIRPDADDFSTENHGKGRWNAQLKCHVTSVNDAINKAKKRGMYVLDR